MTKNTADKLHETANELGIELDVREDYSGRGMFGSQTVGVVVDNHNAMLQIVVHAALYMNPDLDDTDEFETDIENMAADSMGMDVIYY